MNRNGIKQYIVDAFTEHIFSGNPAAVCMLERFPSDGLMMKIAQENNLSETAFAVSEGETYRLRWFTPGGEIDLCGHATLATAYVILNFYHPEWTGASFSTMSGTLTVARDGELYEMDFPAYELQPVPVTDEITAALGVKPIKAYMGRDLLCVLNSEPEVRNLAPDMDRVKGLPGLLLHATAAGESCDCVSRTFAPKLNVTEDPVCGSGHCHIIPYWTQCTGKTKLTACQASRRGGVLYGKLTGKRIFLSGKAALYSEAMIYVE